MSFKTKVLSAKAPSLALISLLAVTAAAVPTVANGTNQVDSAVGGSGDCDQTMDMTKVQDRDMDRDSDGCAEVKCRDYLYESSGPHSQ